MADGQQVRPGEFTELLDHEGEGESRMIEPAEPKTIEKSGTETTMKNGRAITRRASTALKRRAFVARSGDLADQQRVRARFGERRQDHPCGHAEGSDAQRFDASGSREDGEDAAW